MIFVTVGTQLSFDRLVIAVDEWAGRAGGRDVFIQTGRSSYRPRHASWAANVTATQWRDYLQDAHVVVSHAGMGTVISCLEHRKPVVVMARRADLGEHRNDHQQATVARLRLLGLSAVRIAAHPGEVCAALDSPWRTCSDERGTGDGRRQELVNALRDFVGATVQIPSP